MKLIGTGSYLFNPDSISLIQRGVKPGEGYADWVESLVYIAGEKIGLSRNDADQLLAALASLNVAAAKQ